MKINATISAKDRKNIEEVVINHINRKKTEARKNVEKVFRIETERVVLAANDLFNPFKQPNGLELVGQLGIGIGGRPDFNKLDKVTVPLIPKLGVANVGVSFKNKQSIVASYNINTEKFYNSTINKYISTRSNSAENNPSGRGEGSEIMWMKNYIEDGVYSPQHQYVSRGDIGFNAKRSRTGVGHMLPVGISGSPLLVSPVGRDATFGALQRRLEKKYTSPYMLGQIRKAIRAALQT